MALTRSESITLVIFLLALTLNIILLDEDLLRLLGMCGEGRCGKKRGDDRVKAQSLISPLAFRELQKHAPPSKY